MKNNSRQTQEQEKNRWREKQNKLAKNLQGRIDWIQLLEEIKNESLTPVMMDKSYKGLKKNLQLKHMIKRYTYIVVIISSN